MTVTVRRTVDADLDVIKDIYNAAVLSTTATFDLEPRDDAYFVEWLTNHQDDAFGAFSAVASDGTIVGYGTLSTLTPRPGYRVSAEVSVYVHPQHQGVGVGGTLADYLITHADTHGLIALLAIITGTNATSKRLFIKRGFARTGEMRHVALKFGEPQDLHIHQLFFPSNLPSDQTVAGT
ncbi:N-acetyltransferase [Microbacterium lacticum]|uniref:GNAT family N-acetyltransferase n=1 Tax=Microbacterium lacticum TaxID=33885 RepID=UPI0018B043FA|nr:N-acetyltransferase [Microbacterium lacticum]